MIGIGLLSFGENKHIHRRLIVVVFICTLAGFLSGSRAVFVALIPSLILFLILEKQRRRAVLRGLVALGILWGVLIYVAPVLISEFSGRLDSTGSDFYSDYGRLWSAVYTVEEISQKPIIGWGIDHFNEAGLTEVPGTGDIVGVHNTFLKYWHGAGLLGAVGFLAIFALPTRRMLQLLKQRPSGSSTDALRLSLSCFLIAIHRLESGPIRLQSVPLRTPVLLCRVRRDRLGSSQNARCRATATDRRDHLHNNDFDGLTKTKNNIALNGKAHGFRHLRVGLGRASEKGNAKG